MSLLQFSVIPELILKVKNFGERSFPYQVQAMQISDKSSIVSDQLCLVCMESKSSQDFESYPTTNCLHSSRTICNGCMYEYMRNTWNIDSDIACPECSIALTHDTIQQILLNKDDSVLYERYVKLTLDRSLEQHHEFVWCAHGCGSGQLNEGATMNSYVQCVNCSKLTCFKHRCPWHEDMTCEEYDMPRNDGEQHASERWIKGHTKDCSKCHAHIEKNEGCDHMTCSKCKYEFCWECLAPYANIKRHGAYLHQRTCKHYPPTETRTIFKRFIDLF